MHIHSTRGGGGAPTNVFILGKDDCDGFRYHNVVWQHLGVRIALAGVLMLVLTIAPAAVGQSEEESVRLLVPAEAVTQGLRVWASGGSQIGWKRVVVPLDGTIDATVGRLEREMGTIVLVERSYPLLGPEDEPLFGEQWALENTGQGGGTPDADIDAEDAWSIATGVGVVVAVIDSGVNAGHPELDDRMWTNPGEVLDGIDNDGNGFVDDVIGWDFEDFDNDPAPVGGGPDDAHATFIAGIIAAEVDGVGITGVAPGARIMNVRACDNGACFSLDAAEAVVYAVDNGADIINLSFGGAVPESEGDPPIEDAIEYARQHDVLVVSAAGNTPPEELPSNEIFVPAELPHSNNIAVAATDRNDQIADFSFYGSTIDIAAPGVDILSTGLTGYAISSGTSFSAPYVAGTAALLLSVDKGMSHLEVSARLKGHADKPSGVAGKVESGRLNAGDAVPPFIDVLNHLFEADIEWAAEVGVTKGCNPPDNTLFCPDDSVTREQMAAFLNRYLDLPAPSKDYFSDDNNSIFQNDINRLAEAGITKGCNPPANTMFCPKDHVSREQMAAFLVRAFHLSDNTHPGFDDVAANNTFVVDIGKLATAGITKGCNPPANTMFCPKQDVTRGQMTAFLHRADQN
jgi:subtilisin family serine protease